MKTHTLIALAALGLTASSPLLSGAIDYVTIGTPLLTGTEIVSDNTVPWVQTIATGGYSRFDAAGSLTITGNSTVVDWSGTSTKFGLLNYSQFGSPYGVGSLTVTEGARFILGAAWDANATYSNNVTATISAGGYLYAPTVSIDGAGQTVLITGQGSVLETNTLYIGNGSNTGTITVGNGGLLDLSDTGGWLFSIADGSALLFQEGGSLTLQTDVTIGSFAGSYLGTSKVQVFKDGAYVDATLDDFTTISADGLTTYTFGASAVPEPAAYAAIAGGALLAFTLVRRRARSNS